MSWVVYSCCIPVASVRAHSHPIPVCFLATTQQEYNRKPPYLASITALIVKNLEPFTAPYSTTNNGTNLASFVQEKVQEKVQENGVRFTANDGSYDTINYAANGERCCIVNVEALALTNNLIICIFVLFR
jgi:hypothetical protein